MIMKFPRALLALAAAGASLGGCTALDRYAVGETHRLSGAPFYRSMATAPPVSGRIAVLPVTLHRDTATAIGYARRDAQFAPILAALESRLAGEYRCCRPVSGAGLPEEGAPSVYVGSATGELAPPEAAAQVLSTDDFPPMVLHLDRPRPEWQSALGRLAAEADVQQVLLVQLGVSQYPKSRSGLFRKKIVLGTGHEEPIRFLTAEDKPVEVLQLTGVLLDAGGRVLRAGAEGIIARDTPFAAQVFELVRVIDGMSLEAVLEAERREDLPGRPLKWQAALDDLVRQLTGTDR